MRKKLFSLALVVAMGTTMLAGCGGSDGAKDSSNASATSEGNAYENVEEGKVINIYSWK